MENKVTAFLDFGVQKNCYATLWSYGEICVGCGCCGKPSPQRDKARLEYWQEELSRLGNFPYFADDPKLRALQERNIAIDLPIAKRLVRYYKNKVGNLG